MHRARSAFTLAIAPAGQQGFASWLLQGSTKSKVNQTAKNHISTKSDLSWSMAISLVLTCTNIKVLPFGSPEIIILSFTG